MQVQDGKLSNLPVYRSTLHGLQSIVKHEGFRRLYAGLYPNLFGSTVSWGFYFYGYNVMRGLASRMLQPPLHGGPGLSHLSPGVNLVCASSAGVLTAVVTQPIWLAKTRLQLQHGADMRYRGMTHVLASVYHHEGIAGLWRGLVPSLMLVSHVSIHFTMYEEIKKRMHPVGTDGRLDTLQTLIAGSTAKSCASVMTYPFQVVRARMQQIDPIVTARRNAAAAAAAAAAGGGAGAGAEAPAVGGGSMPPSPQPAAPAPSNTAALSATGEGWGFRSGGAGRGDTHATQPSTHSQMLTNTQSEAVSHPRGGEEGYGGGRGGGVEMGGVKGAGVGGGGGGRRTQYYYGGPMETVVKIVPPAPPPPPPPPPPPDARSITTAALWTQSLK